ncbi:hypothetical protein NDU88_005961 [Pleurodeles waltl]|uniref:Uncharacterized protein n=1 Tax=Pleurodeles waltl TaxID=8319 RepID=A0AAV7PK42_PLEWA|nr:hypothetical protein NDU88_005961 [Pleurodeles waltl]
MDGVHRMDGVFGADRGPGAEGGVGGRRFGGWVRGLCAEAVVYVSDIAVKEQGDRSLNAVFLVMWISWWCLREACLRAVMLSVVGFFRQAFSRVLQFFLEFLRSLLNQEAFLLLGLVGWVFRAPAGSLLWVVVSHGSSEAEVDATVVCPVESGGVAEGDVLAGGEDWVKRVSGVVGGGVHPLLESEVDEVVQLGGGFVVVVVLQVEVEVP